MKNCNFIFGVYEFIRKNVKRIVVCQEKFLRK